jgi:hypothetical protein
LDENERIIKHACGKGRIKPHTARDHPVTFQLFKKKKKKNNFYNAVVFARS